MESIAGRFWRFVVEACTSTLPSQASPHPDTLREPPRADQAGHETQYAGFWSRLRAMLLRADQAAHETPYAGFWPRLGALLIDGLVFLPISVTTTWASAQSRTAALALLIPGLALGCGYQVYFHARWGQTLGKMAAHVRVTAVDGSPIGFRQAFLRSAVDILLGVLYVAAYAWALLQIPPAEYASLTWFEQTRRLGELEGPWQWLTWLQGVWTVSEVVTLLFNRRRRALHDFIAGTVVIRTRAVSAVLPSTAV